MKAYLNLMEDILEKGTLKEDRTGTGTLNVFGRQMRFDLKKNFPLLTTKKLHFSLYYCRALVVFKRRYQCQISPRAWMFHLE